MATKKSYNANQFVLSFDGDPTDAGFIKSIDGGAVVGTAVDESVGPDHVHFKHLGRVEIEPITAELGMAMSKPVFQWIKDSWQRKFQRRSGEIIHADFNYKPHYSLSFREALIEETIFPALDGSARQPAYLTVKFAPEHTDLKSASGNTLRANTSKSKQVQWSPSNFRLDIDGIDCSHVNKIDSITVKQKVQKLYFGSSRYPELEPMGVEFSNITVYMAAAFASDFIKWHTDFVVKGDKDNPHQKNGTLDFLSPNLLDTLFSIEFKNLGILSLSLEKSVTERDTMKRVKVEMFAEEFDLTPSGPALE